MPPFFKIYRTNVLLLPCFLQLPHADSWRQESIQNTVLMTVKKIRQPSRALEFILCFNNFF